MCLWEVVGTALGKSQSQMELPPPLIAPKFNREQSGTAFILKARDSGLAWCQAEACIPVGQTNSTYPPGAWHVSPEPRTVGPQLVPIWKVSGCLSSLSAVLDSHPRTMRPFWVWTIEAQHEQTLTAHLLSNTPVNRVSRLAQIPGRNLYAGERD